MSVHRAMGALRPGRHATRSERREALRELAAARMEDLAAWLVTRGEEPSFPAAVLAWVSKASSPQARAFGAKTIELVLDHGFEREFILESSHVRDLRHGLLNDWRQPRTDSRESAEIRSRATVETFCNQGKAGDLGTDGNSEVLDRILVATALIEERTTARLLSSIAGGIVGRSRLDDVAGRMGRLTRILAALRGKNMLWTWRTVWVRAFGYRLFREALLTILDDSDEDIVFDIVKDFRLEPPNREHAARLREVSKTQDSLGEALFRLQWAITSAHLNGEDGFECPPLPSAGYDCDEPRSAPEYWRMFGGARPHLPWHDDAFVAALAKELSQGGIDPVVEYLLWDEIRERLWSERHRGGLLGLRHVSRAFVPFAWERWNAFAENGVLERPVPPLVAALASDPDLELDEAVDTWADAWDLPARRPDDRRWILLPLADIGDVHEKRSELVHDARVRQRLAKALRGKGELLYPELRQPLREGKCLRSRPGDSLTEERAVALEILVGQLDHKLLPAVWPILFVTNDRPSFDVPELLEALYSIADDLDGDAELDPAAALERIAVPLADHPARRLKALRALHAAWLVANREKKEQLREILDAAFVGLLDEPALGEPEKEQSRVSDIVSWLAAAPRDDAWADEAATDAVGRWLTDARGLARFDATAAARRLALAARLISARMIDELKPQLAEILRMHTAEFSFGTDGREIAPLGEEGEAGATSRASRRDVVSALAVLDDDERPQELVRKVAPGTFRSRYRWPELTITDPADAETVVRWAGSCGDVGRDAASVLRAALLRRIEASRARRVEAARLQDLLREVEKRAWGKSSELEAYEEECRAAVMACARACHDLKYFSGTADEIAIWFDQTLAAYAELRPERSAEIAQALLTMAGPGGSRIGQTYDPWLDRRPESSGTLPAVDQDALERIVWNLEANARAHGDEPVLLVGPSGVEVSSLFKERPDSRMWRDIAEWLRLENDGPGPDTGEPGLGLRNVRSMGRTPPIGIDCRVERCANGRQRLTVRVSWSRKAGSSR